MNNRQQAYLQRFNNRVTFDRKERILYGHDIAAIPNLVRPLVGDTTPDAVVQPKNEDELVEVVRWGYQQGISLTPRGKASSGYGGVIPVKKGIVIDFHHDRGAGNNLGAVGQEA
jgi:FAD/FMN-containing dehydrogenase